MTSETVPLSMVAGVQHHGYVGALLPLDVIGGFGLGLAVDGTVRQYLQCDAGARRAVGVCS